jgi:signal transduction histidine kinase
VLGGEIAIDSELDVGTTVRITLERAQSGEEMAAGVRA